MIFMICEDSNSSFEFWFNVMGKVACVKVVDIRDRHRYIPGETVKIDTSDIDDNWAVALTSHGYYGLLETVRACDIKYGDTVMLIFDRISCIKLRKDIKRIREYLDGIGCNRVIVDYLCFEKTMLSYKRLADLSFNKDNKVFNAFKKIVNEWIDHGYSDRYMRKIMMRNEKLFDSRSIDVEETFERIYARILSQYTMSLHRGMKIDKKTMGSCWVKDCDNVKKCNEKQEQNCALSLKGKRSVKAKLLDIEGNSAFNTEKKHGRLTFEEFEDWFNGNMEA